MVVPLHVACPVQMTAPQPVIVPPEQPVVVSQVATPFGNEMEGLLEN
jgi:hypothetical protein